MFEIKQDEYPLYANFKQKVLKYAQKEINDTTDINVDFIEKKQGRKVDKIIFIVKNKKNDGILPTEPAQFEINLILLKRLTDFFEVSETQAKSLFSQYPPSYIADNANYVEKQYKEKKIESISGFLNYALKHDLAHTKQTLFEDEDTRLKEVKKQIADQKKQDELNKEELQKFENDYKNYWQQGLTDYIENLPKNEKDIFEKETIEVAKEKYSSLLRGQSINNVKDSIFVKIEMSETCKKKGIILSREEYYLQNKSNYPRVVIEPIAVA